MSDNVIGIEASAEPMLLPIASFRREHRLWPRQGLCPGRVREFSRLYADEGAGALPPILVLQVEGREYLGDGWHRCAAAEAAGLEHLPAVRKRVARVEDVYLEAVSCSATAGRPLTWVEKRTVVDRLLEMQTGYSDHCLARLAGVSQPFVGKRRRLREKAAAEAESEAKPLLPEERQAQKLVKAVIELDRLAGHLRHTSDGAAIDPVVVIAAAAQTCRGASAATVQARLERWAKRLYVLLGDEEPDGRRSDPPNGREQRRAPLPDQPRV
jgi:hypothetical protein